VAPFSTGCIAGQIMGANILHKQALHGAASYDGAVDGDLLRLSIAHHLRNRIFEVLDYKNFLGLIDNSQKISGAIFFSLRARQLELLIADARASAILAIQRHLDNETFRRRLTKELHYLALRPHLTASFRELMVRPSNLDRNCFSGSRKPNLAVAYQNEAERLAKVLSLADRKFEADFPSPVISGLRVA